MGFWHTGYMEFHESTGLEKSFRPSKVWFSCQHCPSKFNTLDELRRHRFEAHPLARPMLFVRGIEVGATPFRVTRQLLASDIELGKATTASLNGEAVKLAELPMRLVQLSNDRVTVRLANDGAAASFELHVRIAREHDMAGVEAAFLAMARARILSIAAIEGFISECRPFQTADGYYDGICHYLYGVLAKERSSESGLLFDEYHQRYSRAADELKGFERPLAHIVRALVSFHFNHFDDAQMIAPTGRLQHAAVAFAGVLEGWPWHLERDAGDERSSALEDLLTDHETLRILRWAALGANELKACAADIAMQSKRGVPGYDRLKLVVMAAEALAARGDSAAARQTARELIGNLQTAAWAEALLARLVAEEYRE